MIVDLYTTRYVLMHGGKELWLPMRRLIEWGGINALAIFKCATLVLLFYALKDVPMWVMQGLVGLYTAVVGWNVVQVVRTIRNQNGT